MELAKKTGYDTVEFWDWDTRDYERLIAKKQELGLAVSAICAKDRGTLTKPETFETAKTGLKETIEVAKRYLASFQESDIDTLILGCTHYPLLRSTIRDIMGEGVNLVNPAYETAQGLKRLLWQHHLANDGKGQAPAVRYQFYVSDAAEKFRSFASSILPCEIKEAQLIHIEE